MVGAATDPEFSEETIDLLFLLIRLHVEQITCRKSQAIDNREQDLKALSVTVPYCKQTKGCTIFRQGRWANFRHLRYTT